MTSTPEPIFTPRLQLGFGLLAFGVGLMFFCGKVVPTPIAAGIAAGIALGFTGLVVVVVEALRDGPERPGEGVPPPEGGSSPPTSG
jgi:hypothetical protein